MTKAPFVAPGLALGLSLGLLTAPAMALDWKNLANDAAGALLKGQGGEQNAGSSTVAGLSTDQIIAGLKEALRVGAQTVTGQIGAQDGYFADPKIRIPLPENLQTAQSVMRTLGLGAMADDVELKINRGAEAAAPKAKELLWSAITAMTLADARAIYEGPDDAATQYFRRTSSQALLAEIKPVIQDALVQVGALSAYDALVSQASASPFAPDLRGNLVDYASAKALDGLFLYLAEEEASIRQDPAARTTDLLKTVFGQ